MIDAALLLRRRRTGTLDQVAALDQMRLSRPSAAVSSEQRHWGPLRRHSNCPGTFVRETPVARLGTFRDVWARGVTLAVYGPM